MNANAAWAYVWITNPSGDGTNYVWNNKAGNTWDLVAIKDDYGHITGLASAEDIAEVGTASDTITVS
jgi:hypothetical protein